MPDLLVKLYELPALEPVLRLMSQQQTPIFRAIAPQKNAVAQLAFEIDGQGWRDEVEVAFSHIPVGCWIAKNGAQVVGFGCIDATMRGFFGPTGVDENWRGRGIGKALLLACLHDLKNQGYGYAIIGAAGPVEFYQKAVGAIVIENSWPGAYAPLNWGRED